VLFDVSPRADGQDVCTPRLLIFDMRDKFRLVAPEAEAMKGEVVHAWEQQSLPTWAGQISLHQQEPYPTAAFRQTDPERGNMEDEYMEDWANRTDAEFPEEWSAENTDGVGADNWSDFFTAPLNSRSSQPLPFASTLDSSQLPNSFSTYFSGLRSARTSVLSADFHEKWEDSVRHSLERYDRVQGSQYFVDLHGGYGGLLTELCDYMQEECRSAPILCFPFISEAEEEMQGVGAMNLLFSMAALETKGALVCPLSPEQAPAACPKINIGTPNRFLTSAVFAMALDTATIPYHQDEGRITMNQWRRYAIPDDGKNFVSMSLAMRLPESYDSPATDDTAFFHSLFRPFSQTPFLPLSNKHCNSFKVLRAVNRHLESSTSFKNRCVCLSTSNELVTSFFPAIFPKHHARFTSGQKSSRNDTGFAGVGICFNTHQYISPFLQQFKLSSDLICSRNRVELEKNAIQIDDVTEVKEVIINLSEQYESVS